MQECSGQRDPNGNQVTNSPITSDKKNDSILSGIEEATNARRKPRVIRIVIDQGHGKTFLLLTDDHRPCSMTKHYQRLSQKPRVQTCFCVENTEKRLRKHVLIEWYGSVVIKYGG
uniref:Late endosomal/lysosomal adaptor and MAPK and MTOR activator 5 n=1 Tax=Steinernema glaseri TaxID=37863 RepID=A0A1I7YZX0_9BILA